MKYYRVEPTYKKSFIETTLFKKTNEDSNVIYLRKEIGWRWGSFLFSVPETEEECQKYIEDLGYDNTLDWAVDFGHTFTGDDGEEHLPEDVTLQELIEGDCLPDESETFVDITEDYQNAELIDFWDGCWEDWTVNSYNVTIDDDERETIIEEVEAAYEENNEEGVEELGWEYVDTYFELHCNPKITPCDENGNVEEETQ